MVRELTTNEEGDLRSLYCELTGIRSATSGHRGPIGNDSIVSDYNRLMDKLGEVTHESYESYKLVPQNELYSVMWDDYKLKLKSIIGKLYGAYYFAEPNPFINGSDQHGAENRHSVTINNTQTQQLNITFITELKELVQEKMSAAEPGTSNHKFWERLRGVLADTKDAAGVIKSIAEIAHEFGLF
jgi:hypothetical protein